MKEVFEKILFQLSGIDDSDLTKAERNIKDIVEKELSKEDKKPVQYRFSTGMGQVNASLGYPLPFLNEAQRKELDTIGYTGKNSNGIKTTREIYLNSLGIGSFSIEQIKFDNGDFSEEFILSRYN